MINSLEVLIDPLIRNRLESLYNELKTNNSDYKQISCESEQYIMTLRETLPDNLKQTLFLYEDAQFTLQEILKVKIYLQGFKDALQIFNELHISRL
ncbi:hypothetical protein POTG_02216 [Paenibacillus sp. oral taxon 786 str. D14]|jgi:hypothetical protein|uniref:hypothetical protein n=1 Tax=Paenibacillus sp. oral taxon 786 TaxID=652715 RepID=UPI0001AFD9C9|nr:hypothetical protein [Paenibacillus sp. oral taxon 786]EES73116.1 hypothetical protein POTG_02216 [Paenibacillus sp. oral taxon 786 str. D14]